MCTDPSLGIRWIQTQPSQPKHLCWDTRDGSQWELNRKLYIQIETKHFQNVKVSGTNMNPELILESLIFLPISNLQ